MQFNFLPKVLLVMFCLLSACASPAKKPIPLVPQVSLNQFMGDWYVIAAIPTFIEKEAFNAIERYDLNADGTIKTTFTFEQGKFGGKFKQYNPKGFVESGTQNALWGMQFIWPIKSEFRIAYLDANYQTTIIARNARDYVWIMARQPQMSEAEYQHLLSLVKDWGYDTSLIRKVPQQSIDARPKMGAEK